MDAAPPIDHAPPPPARPAPQPLHGRHAAAERGSAVAPVGPPEIDLDAPLQVVINAASGRQDGDDSQQLIQRTLAAAGRAVDFHRPGPKQLPASAARAAAIARARRTAVVAVGGDGTLNAVAQAAHAQGCPMGVLPQGTFNYFARTHGIPTDLADALQVLIDGVPQAVQVGLVNDRLFLVNASLGMYPDLLQDREAYKARFGRSRLVALGAALATLLGRHRRMGLRIESGGQVREVSTTTLFIGNNRLQLEQVGLPLAPALDAGQLAALVLRSTGTLALLGVLARGAMGTLGDADTVDSFSCQRLRVMPRLAWPGRSVKVAYDGEVGRMLLPLVFSVAPRPLYLIKPAGAPAATGAAQGLA